MVGDAHPTKIALLQLEQDVIYKRNAGEFTKEGQQSLHF